MYTAQSWSSGGLTFVQIAFNSFVYNVHLTYIIYIYIPYNTNTSCMCNPPLLLMRVI